MQILALTNMYPTPDMPHLGVFVEQQIEDLRRIGRPVDVLCLDRIQQGMMVYRDIGKRIREWTARHPCDLIHAMYGGVMASRITHAVRDKPVVVSFCGSDLLGEKMSGLYRRLVSGYGVWCSHQAARRATGIVVKSQNLWDALPADVCKRKIAIIPNGVDLSRFQVMDRQACRNRLGWRPDNFHVVFPGDSGRPVKRPELAVHAITIMKQKGIKVEMHTLCRVPHHDVPIWMNAGDVLLLTSLHEGSPNVVKEALACDVPVVSVNVGDVAERIGGIRGCHISDADPLALAACVEQVLAGSRRVAGRETLQEVSSEKIAERLSDYYVKTMKVWKGKTRKSLA